MSTSHFNRIINFISAFNIFTSLLLLSDLFGFNCWVTIHRVTSLVRFNAPQLLWFISVIFSSALLLYMVFRGFYASLASIAVALASYAIFGFGWATLIYAFSTFILFLYEFGFDGWTVLSMIIILCIFEFISLVYWVFLYPLNLKVPLIYDLAFLELSSSSLLSSSSPMVLVFMLYFWILKPLLSFLNIRFGGLSIDGLFSRKSIVDFAILSASIVISVAASLYPYIPSLNPNFYPVGVDFRYYEEALRGFEANPWSVFRFFGGSRPLLIPILYVFKCLFGFDVRTTVTFAPIILNPLLVFSIFMVVWMGFGDSRLASISALFTSIGFKISVNMYSYFLANVSALIFIFLSLSLLFLHIHSKSRVALIFAVVLYNLALLIHPWTYFQFSGSLALFLLYSIFKFRGVVGVLREYYGVFLMLAPSIPLALVLLIPGGSQFWVIYGLFRALNLSNLYNYWYNSFFIGFILYGGFQLNFFTLISALMALLAPSRGVCDDILRFTVIASSIAYPFLDGMLQSRVLFNLPLEVYSAMLVYWVSSSRGIGSRMRSSIISLAVLSQLNYLFRCLANVI
ncbi:MAG: hypothetical protein LM601_01445 [Candidatus Verstraetearchaeota archaeon]|nr:hypothetical protein [Candidatus Verstraetearchaeota archaeon]